ncbi:hypothetical protein EDF56_103158 [Novosphingobium sp. PhB165]|nr:hypothetical protein EDF56_103158 [Novosphingobium sp. PhB165]
MGSLKITASAPPVQLLETQPCPPTWHKAGQLPQRSSRTPFKCITNKSEPRISARSSGSKVALLATILQFFAFAENRPGEHMEEAFQASSPKTFQGAGLRTGPSFLPPARPEHGEAFARPVTTPLARPDRNAYPAPCVLENAPKCKCIKPERRSSATSPRRLVAQHAIKADFFAFAAKHVCEHKERAFQASSPKTSTG